MATLTSALNLYTTDQAGVSSFSLGNSSNTYISVYDPSATSTAGDQCQGLGIPSLSTSSGQSWECPASSSYRNVNSTGWIPVNFSSISGGSPFGNLPVDPANQTSTGLFYGYNTNGSQFEVTAVLESAKYKAQYGNNSATTLFPEVISAGTPTVSALFNPAGLVGYWSLNEGTGSSTLDQSGNGDNGTLYNSPSWVLGKVGPYALAFATSPQSYVSLGSNALFALPSFSVAFWENSLNGSVIFADGYNVASCGSSNQGWAIKAFSFVSCNSTTGTTVSFSAPSTGLWHYITLTYTNNTVNIFVDGALLQSGSDATLSYQTAPILSIGSQTNGPYNGVAGSLDDIRLYNRALSYAEVMALYDAEK
jgi:hypothetical protein